MGVLVDTEKCISCGGCVGVCPVKALELIAKFPACDYSKCTNCNICVQFCPVKALELDKKQENHNGESYDR
jgi:ferredoxin